MSDPVVDSLVAALARYNGADALGLPADEAEQVKEQAARQIRAAIVAVRETGTP